MVLNVMGSLHSIPQQHNFEEARKFFLKAVYQILDNEARFYFDESERKGEAKNRYNCHIEAIAFSIFQSIYSVDGKIPYLITEK